jgi:hypothetical protein
VTDALGYAREVKALAEDKLRRAGHTACGDFRLDEEFGLVCVCGEILGHLEPERPASNLPEPTAPKAVAPLDMPPNVINPDANYTLADVERELLRYAARLESGTAYEVQMIAQREELRLKYELAFAEALVEASKEGGAADVRKARALLATKEQRLQLHQVESLCECTKAAMHNIRAAASHLQTVNASLRTAYGLGGSNGPTPARRPY